MQLEVTDDRITAAHLPGRARPRGTLATGQGSHSSPWSAFVSSVHNAVIGCTLEDAVTGIDQLYERAKKLPGNDRTQFTHREDEAAYAYAGELCDAAQAAAAIEPVTLEKVQRYIGAFLEFRNQVPLSAFKGGLANSKREANNLAIVRNYAGHSEEEVREAIFELLDPSTLTLVFGAIDPDDVEDEERSSDEEEEELSSDEEQDQRAKFHPDLPGKDPEESGEATIAAVIMQHLQTMEVGFPAAYAKAEITVENVIARFGGKSHAPKLKKKVKPLPTSKSKKKKGKRHEDSDDSDGSDSEYEFEESDGDSDDDNAIDNDLLRALLTVPDPTTPALEIEEARSGAFGVGLELDAASGLIRRANINKQDRPRGLFGGDDKKHSTAWITFVEGARARLVGRTLEQAVVGIDGLYQAATELPGAALGKTLTPEREHEFVAARERADAARLAADGEDPSLDSVQRYVSAYLTYRNFVPLSAVDTVAQGSGGKGEGKTVEIVKQYAKHSADEVREAIWKLLDPAAVGAIGQGHGAKGVGGQFVRPDPVPDKPDRGRKISPDVPGAALHRTVAWRIADVIKQHLLTIRTQFPEAFAKAAIGEPQLIEYLEANPKFGLNAAGREEVVEIALPL